MQKRSHVAAEIMKRNELLQANYEEVNSDNLINQYKFKLFVKELFLKHQSYL